MNRFKHITIKVCGIKSQDVFDFLEENQIDFAGFIFFNRSIRYFDIEKNKIFSSRYKIKKVGVFVNPTLNEIEKVLEKFPLDVLQLHGNENANDINNIKYYFKLPIIKAFGVLQKQDIEKYKEFEHLVDYLLFDSKSKEHGGSGVSFNWSMLKDFTFKKPYFVSGGLNANNVKDAIKQSGTNFVDVSSSLENPKGEKSIKLIGDFLKQVKGK